MIDVFIIIHILQNMNKLGEDIIQYYKPYRNHNTKWQTKEIKSQQFQVYDRYEIIDVIGKGAYGIVVAAKDKLKEKQKKQFIAIKKIDKAFDHKVFAKRTLRQLKFLKLLKHDNILGIETLILPKSRQQFQDIYVISELMDSDLTDIIKNKDQKLQEDQIKYILYQVLKGLKYLHSSRVLHRDLKPRNLLISSNGILKICDFGLARCLLKDQKANILSQYVTTRWYRAPEILLSAQRYTSAVDIWSIGCIFAELIKRKPFLPGSDTEDQLQRICQIVGVPQLEDMKHIPEDSISFLKYQMKMTKKVAGIDKMFPQTSPEGLDLLKKCFTFNPQKRITAQQALKHPFLRDFHLQQDEPDGKLIDQSQFEFQDYNLTNQQLKDLLYEETLLYNNQKFRLMYEKKKLGKQSLVSHILKNSNAKYIDPERDYDD